MPFVARCPKCTTELDVGDDVGRGQAVECPVCLTRFVPDRPPPAAPVDPVDPPARPVPPDRADEDRPRRPRDDRDEFDEDDLNRPRRRRRRRGRGAAIDRVSGPAGGLMAIGWIGIVFGGLGLFFGILMIVIAVAVPPQAVGPAPPGQPPFAQQLGINAASNLVSGLGLLVIGIIIVYGAGKMKRLEGYGWAQAAAWLSVLPCFSPCCILGLIFGIQAIQALNDADVRAAFRREPEDDEE